MIDLPQKFKIILMHLEKMRLVREQQPKKCMIRFHLWSRAMPGFYHSLSWNPKDASDGEDKQLQAKRDGC